LNQFQTEIKKFLQILPKLGGPRRQHAFENPAPIKMQTILFPNNFVTFGLSIRFLSAAMSLLNGTAGVTLE